MTKSRAVGGGVCGALLGLWKSMGKGYLLIINAKCSCWCALLTPTTEKKLLIINEQKELLVRFANTNNGRTPTTGGYEERVFISLPVPNVVVGALR